MIIRGTRWCRTILAGLFQLIVLAAPAAARSPAFIVGVGTKFAHDQAMAPTLRQALAASGVNAVREDLSWARFKRPDIFSPLPAGQSNSLTGLTDAARSGVRPMIILGVERSDIEAGHAPTQPASVTAFARYAAAMTALTKNLHPIYEVWNEWNHRAGGDNSAASADAYVRLADATIAAVRNAGSDAPIVVGAAAGDPGWQWSSRIAASGILKRAAGFSIHQYFQCRKTSDDRSALGLLKQLESAEQALTQASGLSSVPIYLSEVGWWDQGVCAIPPDRVAVDLAQTMLTLPQKPWMAGFWVYELHDSAAAKTAKEASFGVYRSDFSAKPAACVLARLSKMVETADPAGLFFLSNGAVVSRYRTANGPVVAAWAAHTGQSVTVTAQLRSGNGQVEQVCGEKRGRIGGTLVLGDQPVLISGDVILTAS